jgi:signal transduction histidine kinase
MQRQPTESIRQTAADVSLVIDRAIQQVRNISHLLHPPLLDEVGLHSALQWYLEGFTKRSGIQISLDVQPNDFPRLVPEAERAVFRIIQEALTNVFRHSEAHTARVNIAKEDHQIMLTVSDDGKGISDHIAGLRPGSIGVGISSMKQRVKELGGELRLRNIRPGTAVGVTIPIGSVVMDCPPVQTTNR